MDQIEKADCYIVDDSPLLTSCLTEDDELMFNWHDEEGGEFVVRFGKESLSKAKIVGKSIFVKADGEDEDSQITIFKLVPIDLEKEFK